MTRVFKIQELEFMRNAMDSRLRGNDKRTHETMDTGRCRYDGVKKIPRTGGFLLFGFDFGTNGGQGACALFNQAVQVRLGQFSRITN